MSIKLWLDDIRPAPDGWVWAKTAIAAINILQTGEVTEISLDHDLGENVDSGYDVACWIEKNVFSGNVQCPKWHVHSANPVGAARITMAMRSAEGR